eukprot:TRINITY_DN1281_c0_g1_i6.p2 TRINITY_DN1281_c0_g1~~TRINITY_DN1281_c0_g1_i6.p2  ORF type:complete len:208 (+),score=29.36 TRINITY_DN1281_c0_g1_i6:630-1253(+)
MQCPASHPAAITFPQPPYTWQAHFGLLMPVPVIPLIGALRQQAALRHGLEAAAGREVVTIGFYGPHPIVRDMPWVIYVEATIFNFQRTAQQSVLFAVDTRSDETFVSPAVLQAIGGAQCALTAPFDHLHCLWITVGTAELAVTAIVNGEIDECNYIGRDVWCAFNHIVDSEDVYLTRTPMRTRKDGVEEQAQRQRLSTLQDQATRAE